MSFFSIQLTFQKVAPNRMICSSRWCLMASVHRCDLQLAHFQRTIQRAREFFKCCIAATAVLYIGSFHTTGCGGKFKNILNRAAWPCESYLTSGQAMSPTLQNNNVLKAQFLVVWNRVDEIVLKITFFIVSGLQSGLDVRSERNI
jgi:hypothetical protein